MRKTQWALPGVVSVVVVGGVAWTILVGGASREAGQVQAPSAAALHQEAIVVDGHVHIVESVFHQGIDPWKVQPTGVFDYARAKQGGLDVVIHTVWTEDAYFNYNYGVKQALRLIETFYRILEANQDKMELALTSADVRRIVAKGKMAAILALEGNPDTEGDLDVLQMWYRLGVRMIQLTSHNTTNALVDAEWDEHKWGGITDRGRAFIREMNRLGIIVDISHASEEAAFQIIAASEAPVAANHNALVSAAQVPRLVNGLSDELFKALAAKGGLLAGIQWAVVSKRWADWRRARPQPPMAWLNASQMRLLLPNQGIRPPDKDYGAYLAALDAETDDFWTRDGTANRGGFGYGTPWRARLIQDGVPVPTAADWVEHAGYAIKLGGADHVGIGLDLMSRPTLRDFDATQYPRLTEAMLAKDLSPDTIKKVLGENWLRLLDQAKVPGLKPPAPTGPSK